jgi:hypothetical protein
MHQEENCSNCTEWVSYVCRNLCTLDSLSYFSPQYFWRNSPQWATASSFTRFLDHTQWRATVGRIPLEFVAETSTWQHTTLTTDRHPCPRCDSNPQYQQQNGRRRTPYTARPLGPAFSALLSVQIISRSQWPRGLSRGYAAASFLGLLVRIHPAA